MSSSLQQQQVYQVEHLATFSMVSHQPTTPKAAIQRLFAMEKASGIWTQRMAIQVEERDLKIMDGDSGEVVERFPVSAIQQPTAFSQNNIIYDNILLFSVQHPDETTGELHIFQCNSHSAQDIVNELKLWMTRFGNVSHDPTVSVKDAVHAFNAIAAQRESIKSCSSIDSSSQDTHRNGHGDQSLANERFVSILNHCFDDIERFVIRLQHAAAALRELQQRNHKRKGHSSGDGLLAMRARGPSEDEFFEILSKFKLAFNLLAKLKGCIHDPNAPELVHFLFTPLAIIVEAARSNVPLPVDPCVVSVPFLSPDAIELLSNCCTSKEFDLWQSLSVNWTQPARHHMQSPRIHPVTFQPVFSDGWAPTINEPELMGLVSSDADDESASIPISVTRDDRPASGRRVRGGHYDDSDVEEPQVPHHHHPHHPHERISPLPKAHNNHHNHSSNGHAVNRLTQSSSPSPIESGSLERDSPAGVDIEQVEWLSELQSRNAKVVKVLFPRTANNDKELTVTRGEFLELLDDTRKWWKARNCRGQVAHVPHTIVTEAVVPSGGNSHPSSPSEDWIRRERQGKKGEFRGFTTDFLSQLLLGLKKEETRTGTSPLQALVKADKSQLQKYLDDNLLDEMECFEFYETLGRCRRRLGKSWLLHV